VRGAVTVDKALDAQDNALDAPSARVRFRTSGVACASGATCPTGLHSAVVGIIIWRSRRLERRLERRSESGWLVYTMPDVQSRRRYARR